MNEIPEYLLITRKELYDCVWETPVQKLAQEFHISDVGLNKICKRNNIPVPPRGYWAKKEYGKKLPKKPALPSNASWGKEIQIYANKRHGGTNLIPNTTLSKLDDIEIIMKNELVDPHPLGEKTKQILGKSKKDNQLIIPREDSRILNIQVSLGSLDYALRIMDALTKYMQERQISIQVQTKHRKMSVFVENEEEEIEFLLKEKFDRTPHIPTKSEISKAKKYSWHQPPEFDFIPNGKLTLSITNVSYLGVQQNWSDGKVQRLENCLGKFYKGILETSYAMKKRREERERQKREWAEQERIYEEQRRLTKIEEYRKKKLIEEIQLLNLSTDIKNYISYVEQSMSSASEHNQTVIQDWIKWTQNYLNYIDPLKRDFGLLMNIKSEW